MNLRFIIFSLFFLLTNLSIAQITLRGIVKDAYSKPLLGTHVLLNGEQKFAKVSDDKGVFIFKNIPEGNYQLKISYTGYTTKKLDVFNLEANRDLGNIKLEFSSTKLSEVAVEAKIPLAIIREDTIEYNADAYKTNPDADAQDLIQKMPGITVEDGTVEAQGEQVKKVYVDGKPFFDQDPTLALKNIPAEVIQKIEVFDEMSDQAKFTGFDDGETTKVMNIITRAKMKNGQFGKLYVGGGYPDKYQAGGSVNIFNGDQRISIIAQSNNVNQQNFSTEDLLGVTGSSSRRGGGFRGGGGPPSGGGGKKGGRSGGGNSQDFMVGQQAGISTTHALGINYSDKWGKKINVSGSYFFNMTDNEKNQNILQQYFTESEDLQQEYAEQNNTLSTNYNHRLNLRLMYDMNDNNHFMLNPRISFQGNESVNDIYSSSYLNDSLLNSNYNKLNTDMAGYKFSNTLLWMHKFEKQGRTISFRSKSSLSSKDYESTQFSQNLDFVTMAMLDSLNQFTFYDNPKNGISGRVVYTEPIGEKAQLMINGSASVDYDDSDRKVYNWNDLDSDYSIFDTAMSNVFKSTYETYQAGLGYMYRLNRNHLMVGLNYQNSILNSNQDFPETNKTVQSYQSLLPMVRFKYKISRTKNLNLFYRTNTQSPSVSQLQNTIDNSNPLQLEYGNPELKETYNHQVMARYSSANLNKANVFFIMGSFQYTNDYIGNNTVFATQDTLINGAFLLQQGGQITQPVNLDHYMNARFVTTYGFPVKPIKSNLNLSLNYTYAQTPGIYNNIENYSDNNNVGFGITLASNISEKIDFTVSSNSNYNQAKSSLQTTTDNNYLNQKTKANLSIILWKDFVFRSSFTNQYYYWTESGTAESYNLWNMELGKKFLKNNTAEIKLTVFDILGQNNSITRNVTDIYVEDMKTNTIEQYFMLSFSYKLRNFRIG